MRVVGFAFRVRVQMKVRGEKRKVRVSGLWVGLGLESGLRLGFRV